MHPQSQVTKWMTTKATSSASGSDRGKKVSITAQHINETFDIMIFPGSSNEALHRTVASRARVPMTLPGGLESFFLTSGGPSEAVFPLCDGLPDGMHLTMHLHAAAPGADHRAPPAVSLGGGVSGAAQAKAPGEEPRLVATLELGHGAERDCYNFLQRLCSCYGPDAYTSLPPDGQDSHLQGVQKMSRLATDMANERTLLAWIRTVLAIMRTAFATAKMVGVGALWTLVHKFALFMTISAMVCSTVVGYYRYRKVREIVKRRDIPNFFGRLPIWPVHLTLGMAIATIAIMLYGNGLAQTGGEDAVVD